MKKNGLLTFIFACIPGAGQMYYGYMQRGLSIAMILILCVMAATVVEPLLFLCLVIWMYSFFDTYDLIRHMAAGEPKEDSLLVLGNYEEIKKMVPQHNRLIGWGLVGFGVWALYETFISTWLYTLLCNLMGNGYAYDIIRGIPNVVIAALLIFAGLKLLGLHPEKKNRDDELPPYPHEYLCLPPWGGGGTAAPDGGQPYGRCSSALCRRVGAGHVPPAADPPPLCPPYTRGPSMPGSYHSI